jgi:hypothetical protein
MAGPWRRSEGACPGGARLETTGGVELGGPCSTGDGNGSIWGRREGNEGGNGDGRHGKKLGHGLTLFIGQPVDRHCSTAVETAGDALPVRRRSKNKVPVYDMWARTG